MINPTIDPQTGVIRPTAEVWPELRARAEQLREDTPDTPAEVDRLMRRIEDLSFELADFLVIVNGERYDAEIAHSKRYQAGVAKHGRVERSVTVAKALAEIDAETEYATLLAKKAIYHHVEDISRALGRKHYGLMNTNKGIQAMLGSHGRRIA